MAISQSSTPNDLPHAKSPEGYKRALDTVFKRALDTVFKRALDTGSKQCFFEHQLPRRIAPELFECKSAK